MYRFLSLALATTLAACSSSAPNVPATQPTVEPTVSGSSEPDTEPQPEPQTAPESAGSTMRPTEAEVGARVADAKMRLAATPGGLLVWQAIEAHGGLDSWLGAGPLHFRFNYKPLGRPATDTYEIVDPWSSLARHQVAPDRTIEFGWDGEKAWVKPADAETTTNPRFWALTPYYFVGMPFVLGDPGAKFEKLADASLEGKTYNLVKASFGAGVGDAPDDYYVLYLDPTTKRLRALRYVVSYPGFFPDGGHGPEKLMTYDGEQTVGDMTLARSHRTFKFDEESGEVGELVTEIDVTDVELRPETEPSYFAVPTGARVIDGWK